MDATSGIKTMFHLRVLGRIELGGPESASVQSVLSQPKRIALLTFLAAAGDTPVSRDRLAETFWPDSSRDRAQHSVSQAIYALRRDLGKRTIHTSAPGLVGLDASAIQVDLWEFERALAGAAYERALEHYSGDLLSGLHFHDLAPFERWLDEERERLRRKAVEGALVLAEARQASGALKEAALRIRWAMELVPYAEEPLRRLLLLKEAAGDRGGAAAEFERFAESLERDLGVQPSEITLALISRITRASDDPGRDASPEVAGKPVRTSGVEARPFPGPSADPSQFVASSSTVRPSTWSDRLGGAIRVLRGGRPLPLVAGLTALVGFTVLALVLGPSQPEAHTATSPDRVAVFPFTFHGSEEFEYLAEGVAELLSISLDGIEGIRAVDPRSIAGGSWRHSGPVLSVGSGDAAAREYGADHFVLGSILEAGGRIQVTADVYRTGGELTGSHVERAETEGKLFELVDELVRHFLAGEYLAAGSPLVPSAAATTHSLPALKSFLRGEHLFRVGDYAGAMSAFSEAADRDESFALAHYRAAMSHIWTGSSDFEEARDRVRLAMDHSRRLSDSQVLLIQALKAFLHGSGPEAEELYRRVLSLHPENVEAWFNLGEVLFHHGPLSGTDVTASRLAWERVIQFDPDHRGALVHMAAIAAVEGQWEELDGLVAKLSDLQPDGLPAPHIDALAAWGYGDHESRERVLLRLHDEPLGRVRMAASYLVRYLDELSGAGRAVAVLLEPSRPVSDRIEGHLWLAYLAVAGGREREAGEHLDRVRRLDPDAAILHQTVLASMPDVPVEMWALNAASEEGFQEDPPGVVPTLDAGPRLPRVGTPIDGGGRTSFPPLEPYLAVLGSGSDDPGVRDLREAARQVEASTEGHPFDALARTLVQGLRAEADLLEGRAGSARRLLVQSLEETEYWYEMLRVSPIYSLSRERFRLAELLMSEGEFREALGWLEALGQSSIGEVIYLVPSHLRRAELHELRGDLPRALHHYEEVLRLWDRADSTFHPVLAEVRARADRLERDGSRMRANL